MDKDGADGFLGCAVEALANVHKHAGGGVVSRSTRAQINGADASWAPTRGPGIAALSLPTWRHEGVYAAGLLGYPGHKSWIVFADRVYLSTRPRDDGGDPDG